MWAEDVDEKVPQPTEGRQVVHLDELDDGRCKASTWRLNGHKPAKPTYENHFGPGGFNRCIGSEGHSNRLHKDEWGYVFSQSPETGKVKVVRLEAAPPVASTSIKQP